MLIFAWLSWWYTRGWLECVKRVDGFARGIVRSFSVGTLIRTLFAPWKQIVSLPDPNETIAMKFRGFLDTLVSRFVGLMIRSFTLLAAVISLLVISVIGVVMIMVWPFVPLAVPVLLVKGMGVW